ncbi:MAG TPA: hypothetical protein VIH57_06850, partial [Bacteroidales bacterium]
MRTILRFIVLIMVIIFSGIVLEAQTITVDAGTPYQFIRGFGGMNFPRWVGDLTSDQADKAFGNNPGQIGLSMLRMSVNPD